MTTLQEGNLTLELPVWAVGRRFNGTTHGLSHCMRAVDFVVELADDIYFIEFKDPENPAARSADRNTFVSRFQSGELDKDLRTKYRDSFLYEWAADRVNKPVHYLVLVAITSLDAAMLAHRTDALKRDLPVDGPANGAWKRKLVEQCLVLNIAEWNRWFPHFPVTRLVP